MKFIVHTVYIRGLPIYECSVIGCGARQTGRTVRLNLESVDPEVVATAVRSISTNHMPEGWSAYGLDDIRCPEHLTESSMTAQRWMTRFIARLRARGLTEEQISFIVDADGGETHIDLSPEKCADEEISSVNKPADMG